MIGLQILAGLAGGIGLFVYGMQLCSVGLQKMAASRLKQMVKAVTSHPVLGVLVGAIVTLALQGSNITSALVVGFVSAGMMNLSQALGVLLGSAIGSSLTAQLIAFKTTDFGLLLLFCGAVLGVFSKHSRKRNLGRAIFGFGLIFYGMYVMAGAMAPVRDYPVVVRILVELERYPFLEFVVGMVITTLIQSSAAFLALLMTLATQHLVGPMALIPFILGAHLGGTVTGVISSLGAPGRDAKRAAWANFLIKLINGLVFLPFYRPLTHGLLGNASDLQRGIANTHTFFSVVMAIGFLPFTYRISQWMIKLIPDAKAGLGDASMLDEQLLEVPELAIGQAQRQTLEMGRIIDTEMLERVIPVIRYGNDEVLDRIFEVEQAIDALYKQISDYLTRMEGHQLDEELLRRSMEVLYVANDLEHIGDIMISIAKNAGKLHGEGLQFSEEGLEEMEEMFQQALSNYRQSLQAFATADIPLATGVIKEHPKILRLEKALRYSHFDRMQCGNEKTAATSSIHLDLIEALLRLDSHAMNIAQVVVGIA